MAIIKRLAGASFQRNHQGFTAAIVGNQMNSSALIMEAKRPESQAGAGPVVSPADRLLHHPLFVLRIGGESADIIGSLRSTNAAHVADGLAELRSAGNDAIARACGAIEAAVATVPDAETKRDLIRLKRDLFNGRRLDDRMVAAARSLPDASVAAELDAATRVVERRREAEAAMAVAYDADVAATALALRRASGRPNLRSALISASAPLVETLGKLEAGRALSRKDWSNLHVALAGFVTRATVKTSPRSSFTLVALGTWGGDGTRSPLLEINRPVIARETRIRHGVLERLLLPALRDADVLAPGAPITVNRTARFAANGVEWQRVAYGEHPEMETLGIVSTTNRLPLPAPVLEALGAMAAGGVRDLEECGDFLGRRVGGGARDAGARLVRKLLALDLLVLDQQWPMQGDKLDWASSLRRWTRPGIEQVIAEGVQGLVEAGGAVDTAELSAAPRRRFEREVDALAERLGTPLRAADLKPVFHEDCRIVAPSIMLRQEALSVLWDDLAGLLDLLPLLRGYGWAAAWLTSRFVATFGQGGCCEDPLAFLGGTAEALLAANGGSQGAPPWQTGTVPDDPDARAQNIVSARFADALREHNGGAAEWTVPPGLVAEFQAMLPPGYRRRARSHCINGQLASINGERRFVLNSVYPGNGRMTSRFLQPGDADAVAAYVREIAPGEPIAIPGVFGFNANVHPPLSARELVIPPYPADYAATAKVQLAGCRLRHDPALNLVVVEGPGGERLSPFYFGILNSWALPPVHRALDWLNGASDLPFAVPDAIVSRDRPVDPPAIWVRPRIVMGGIVLGRRAWSLASSTLPDPTLDDLAFFLALRATWASLALPRTVFFQASNFWRTGGAGASRPSKTRKPMYLDIDNVWMVKAFGRSLRSITGHLVVTECLPEPGDTPIRIDGEPHTAEITIEAGVRETHG